MISQATARCAYWIPPALLVAAASVAPIAAGAEPVVRLGAELPSYQAPAADPAAAQPPRLDAMIAEPRGSLSLRQAIAAALLQSPALAAGSWEVRVREARAIQAGLLPNPSLLVELENVAGGGAREEFEQAETTVWLSQLVPIGGKRAARREVAERLGELARWDYEVARVDVLTSTAMAFVATLGAQQRLVLLEELEEVARAGIATFEQQVRAGAAPRVARTRAEVVLHTVQLEQAEARRQLATSRLTLASTWGATTATFDEVRGDLSEHVSAPPPLRQLDERIHGNPDVARWVSELAVRRASLSAAKAQRLPDPTFLLGGRHFNDTGDAAIVAAFSMPIPVFDRNQGDTLAAARDLEKARAQQAAAELGVRAALARRHQDLVTAFEQSRTLAEKAVPAARDAFAGAREGYRKGIFQYLDVLDAQRMLYDLRARRLDNLVAYHRARADIERLLGAPLFEEEGVR